MTEPSNTFPSPSDEEGSHASVGKDVSQAGGGRTESETAVDDALGAGDDASS